MAKRSNGDGSLRQRKDGRWELTIMDGYQRDGKKNLKTFYGMTPEEAEKKALEYKTAKTLGHVIEKSYRFSEWSDLWFEHHKNSIAPTTQESYRYTLRILKDAFGHRYINEIKAYDIEVFLQKLQTEGKSHSMLAKCRGMLFQIFNKAEANDYVLKNPVRFAEKQRQTEPVARKESFTREEMVLMMEHLPDTKIGWSIRLMLGTGMRTQ